MSASHKRALSAWLAAVALVVSLAGNTGCLSRCILFAEGAERLDPDEALVLRENSKGEVALYKCKNGLVGIIEGIIADLFRPVPENMGGGGGNNNPGGQEPMSQNLANGGVTTLRTNFDGEVQDTQRIRNGLESRDAELEPLATADMRLPGGVEGPRRAFFTDTAGGQVLVLDAATGATLGAIPVGRRPQGLAFSPDGATLYVANSGSSNVSVIDVANMTVTDTIDFDNVDPLDVAVTPDGRELIVTAGADNSGTVYFVDAATMAILGQRSTSPDPERVAISPDGHTAFVLSTDRGRVSILDILSRTPVAAVRFDNATDLYLGPNGRNLFVAGGGAQGRLAQFDIATLEQTREWTLGDTPTRINATPGGALFLVTHLESEFISLVDPRGPAAEEAINIPSSAGLGPAIVSLRN